MINNVDKMNINCVCGSVQEHLVTAVWVGVMSVCLIMSIMLDMSITA